MVGSIFDIFNLDHPSMLVLDPNFDEYVGNDTMIKCTSTDGYPKVTPKWTFEHGPVNSSQFFEIDNTDSTLHIKKTAPLGSKWEFMCTAMNIIPQATSKGVALRVDFTIGGQWRTILSSEDS